ncbi:hypothetical protein FHS29_002585 [Saccharothrix tamanrassetensis]|uniref:Uncharacterized protein n=1 Tax=Saccharothrix tamanrassetensis TaxID=1051531 RepID=A0A841CI14_9PSEU|nr:hypothetical protein [Saccharothrix tamanrassetensis]
MATTLRLMAHKSHPHVVIENPCGSHGCTMRSR